VSRYLAATRAGAGALQTWRKQLRTRRDLLPPNKCTDCPKRPKCHEAFGAIDGVGLFPFTEKAVTNFYNVLKEDDKGQTHRTPRGLVQHVLAPTLLNPENLDRMQYPGREIESWGLDREQLGLAGDLRNLLEAQVPDQLTRERLHRVLRLWGEPSQAKI